MNRKMNEYLSGQICHQESATAEYNERTAEIIAAREADLPQLAKDRPFQHFGSRRHCHARLAALLCAALRCLQKTAVRRVGPSAASHVDCTAADDLLPLLTHRIFLGY